MRLALFCGAPGNFSDYSPQEFYVLQSIHGVWWWYTSIWWAVLDAGFLVSLNASAIVREINPINPGDISLGVLLSALSAGFGFLAFPASQAGTAAASIVATAIGQAPGLAKALLPTGSLDSEFTQLSSIDTALSRVVQHFQINLANTLNETLFDFTSFMSFATNGSFIAQPPSLNASTGRLTKVLSTFIVSQTLQANNIIATVAYDVSPYNLTHDVGPKQLLLQNHWHVNCQDEPNEYGICDNWWYNRKPGENFTEGRGAYALFNMGDIGKNYYDLMNTMFAQGWTLGEDLFLGARQCMEQIDRQNINGFAEYRQAYSLSINPLTLEPKCASNVRLCEWDQAESHNLVRRRGEEFVQVRPWVGCAYGWPDFCDRVYDGENIPRNLFLSIPGPQRT